MSLSQGPLLNYMGLGKNYQKQLALIRSYHPWKTSQVKTSRDVEQLRHQINPLNDNCVIKMLCGVYKAFIKDITCSEIRFVEGSNWSPANKN